MWAAKAKAKTDIPLVPKYGEMVTIKKGTEITITKGDKETYALWGYGYIWDLPEQYVGEIVLIYSKD